MNYFPKSWSPSAFPVCVAGEMLFFSFSLFRVHGEQGGEGGESEAGDDERLPDGRLVIAVLGERVAQGGLEICHRSN